MENETPQTAPAVTFEHSESITKIAPALVKAQIAMGSASKDSDNPFFKSKYADYNAVLQVCKGPLNDNDVVILHPTGTDAQGKSVISTVLLHSSGEYISATMEMREVTNMQKIGSSSSYGRRYTLQNLMAIPTSDDDDGNAVSDKSVTKAPTKTPAKTTGNSTAPKRMGFGGNK